MNWVVRTYLASETLFYALSMDQTRVSEKAFFHKPFHYWNISNETTRKQKYPPFAMSFLVIVSLQVHNLWKSFPEYVVCASGQLFLGISELWILWKMSFIASEKWGHNSVWQVIFAFICNTIVLFMFLGTHWFQPVPIWHWEVHNCGEMVLWNFGDQWVPLQMADIFASWLFHLKYFSNERVYGKTLSPTL